MSTEETKQPKGIRHPKFPGPFLIEWIDPQSSYGRGPWRTLNEVRNIKPALIRSVGYVILETEELIILAAHVGTHEDDEDISGDVSIPKANIKRQRKLK